MSDEATESEKPVAQSGPGVLTIARGVALGLIAVLAFLFLINEMTKQSPAECSNENLQRLSDGLPQKVCD